MAARVRTRSSRQAVLDAACNLLSVNPGASLGEIAGAAGVGRTTIHRHFQSRGELIRELSLSAIDDTGQAIAAARDASTPRESLRLIVEGVVPLADRYHFLATQAAGEFWDEQISGEYQRQMRDMERMIERLKAEDLIASDVPPAWARVALESLVWGAWFAMEDGSLAPKDAPDLVIRTLLAGLGPRL